MTTTLKIDFVSDVSCPWCAVGLGALEHALARIGDAVQADLHFQPFELNPDMAPEGQDISEHIAQKYGSTPEQMAQSRETIRQRGAEVGFEFRMADARRIYNTFDAHRLLHWAEEEGSGLQPALKKRLLKAYFTEGRNPSDPAVLVRLAADVGLDAARAEEILDGDKYAAEVRARERYYRQHGISAVPAVVINDRHLISGGQPAAVFEQALRQIAAGND
ncbi:DsbA family oxidoreductase [Xylophilus sp. Leaf220]|uniref:DsbA family oxidoreductase n=1 Tax=Xylophilus sp. Leaf220 TaxID=1735686 RepID=UPI0006FFA67D|nr:DsbA family oxidoreductase [Xylophilus sp. Leaf220]KQM79729.1 disulfide bond formation protein DsbA [Xylophilus sp. Leaf220]